MNGGPESSPSPSLSKGRLNSINEILFWEGGVYRETFP